MKYAYIVTRITFDDQPGVKEIPNLGVHTSYKKAMRHYKSVREDRQRQNKGTSSGGQCVANTAGYPWERYTLLMSDNFPNEEIRLEKWIISYE